MSSELVMSDGLHVWVDGNDVRIRDADNAPIVIHGHDIEDAHARAINAGLPQCPKCTNGWLNYRVNNDQLVCFVCGYTAGKTEPQDTAA